VGQSEVGGEGVVSSPTVSDGIMFRRCFQARISERKQNSTTSLQRHTNQQHDKEFDLP
jgi:hypothetical protein